MKQEMSGESSGGMRIDNHAFFGGKGSPTFPKGNAVKTYSSAEGSGSLTTYEDTSEKIHAAQEMAKKKVKSHMSKPEYRN